MGVHGDRVGAAGAAALGVGSAEAIDGCCCGHRVEDHSVKNEQASWHRPCDGCLCVELHGPARYHALGECAEAGYGEGVMDYVDTVMPDWSELHADS